MADLLPKFQQENVLVLLCFDAESSKLIRNTVDEAMFDAPFYRTIAAKAYAYIDRYHDPPREHIADELTDQFNGEHGKVYREILHDLYNARNTPFNTKYVLDSLTIFLRKRKFETGLVRAANAVQADELDEAYNIMQSSMEYNLTLFDPGVRLSDIDKALSESEDEEPFPTGVKELDERGLGPARGQLITLAASAKKGKSWWLVNLGRRALMVGARVCHITLEISERDLHRRYIQSLLACTKRPAGVLYRERFKEDERGRAIPALETIPIPARPSLADDDILKYAKAQFKLYGSKLDNLFIKPFPSGTLTVPGINAYLDSLEQQQQFMPDLLLIDYINLMKVKERGYEEFINLYTDIRGIAGARNIAVATVAQINREGNNQTGGSEKVAESYGTVGVVDTFLVFTQTTMEYRRNAARLYVSDTRVGDENQITVYLEQDYKIGQFCVRSYLWPKWMERNSPTGQTITPTNND